MTTRAALPHGFVFEDKPPSLFLVTLGAVFPLQLKRELALWLANLPSVRLVAIHAVHLPLRNEVMIRHAEFRVRLEVAVKTGRRILPRIHDEFVQTLTTRGHMPTARPVTGFTTCFPGHLELRGMKLPVRTRRKNPRVIGVTINACSIAHKGGTFDLRRRHRRRRQC